MGKNELETAAKHNECIANQVGHQEQMKEAAVVVGKIYILTVK